MALKILFADDDPLMLQLYRPHIQSAGYEWFGASNGREAIAATEREKPNLAIIDILMPELDGLEVLLELKKSPAAKIIPVILITAESGYYLYRSNFANAGAAHFLLKPFGPKQLLDAIRFHLNVAQI
ncbi:MAG TPA: response regulator [Candidatus Limnocylindrales bacterium]|jgi:DNA-binding response OmpR family regulator|nr:response regulator [Candidatus Limnocylindrales bacterium]